MAMQNPDARIDDAITAAQTAASGALQKMTEAAKGAGPQAHAALQELTSRASVLPSVGTFARDYITKLAADDSLPADYRRAKVREIHAAAATRLNDEHDALVKKIMPALEATLSEGSLPQPSTDAADRMLRRQELDRLLSGVTGPALAGRMTDLLGRNPAWDSEMLSDHGRALLEAGGVGQDWPNFRKASAAKLMSSTVGTERMLASRRALAAFHQLKVRGQVFGLHQIAKSRLGDL